MHLFSSFRTLTLYSLSRFAAIQKERDDDDDDDDGNSSTNDDDDGTRKRTKPEMMIKSASHRNDVGSHASVSWSRGRRRGESRRLGSGRVGREKFSLLSRGGLTREEREENIRRHARDVLQRLVGELFALPSESDVNGRFALLPPGQTKFPRSLPLPSLVKPKTKWEQFAEEKGIKKRKRSKMVFDEQQDEWKRRHGYDRANDPTKIAIVEAKLSSRAGETEDPFLKERKDKKARVEKNEMQRRRNLGEQVKARGAEALPATLRLAIGNNNNNNNSSSKKGGSDRVGAKSLKSKQLVKDVQYKVATSTASVGKFNAPLTRRLKPEVNDGRSRVTLTKAEKRQRK